MERYVKTEYSSFLTEIWQFCVECGCRNVKPLALDLTIFSGIPLTSEDCSTPEIVARMFTQAELIRALEIERKRLQQIQVTASFQFQRFLSIFSFKCSYQYGLLILICYRLSCLPLQD